MDAWMEMAKKLVLERAIARLSSMMKRKRKKKKKESKQKKRRKQSLKKWKQKEKQGAHEKNRDLTVTRITTITLTLVVQALRAFREAKGKRFLKRRMSPWERGRCLGSRVAAIVPTEALVEGMTLLHPHQPP